MRYKKKPVVIEAIQFTGLNWAELEGFIGRAIEGRGGKMVASNSSDSQAKKPEFGGIGRWDPGWIYLATFLQEPYPGMPHLEWVQRNAGSLGQAAIQRRKDADGIIALSIEEGKGCRCGKVHEGEYALEDWGHHQCLHEEELTGVEVEKGKACPESGRRVQVVCPGCGQAWIATIRGG